MKEPGVQDWAHAIRALAPWAARIHAPDFTFGAWHGSERRADGAASMPWFEVSADGAALLTAAGGFLLPDFEWPAWILTDEALRLRDDPEALASASPRQVAQLLTALIRQDRFVEGALDASVTSGLLGRVLDRVAALAEELAHTAG